MLILLPPTKTLDVTPLPKDPSIVASPLFLSEAAFVNQALKKLTKKQYEKIMNVSENLTNLNRKQNDEWQPPFSIKNAKPAMHMYSGQTYVGLSPLDFSTHDCAFAQKHIRIISGLYGLLQPMDLIQPYRLEMSCRLKVGETKNLYEYWGGKVTYRINEILKQRQSQRAFLINLASQEYTKTLLMDHIDFPIITPIFKEKRNETYKIIRALTKKARGMMARYIVKYRVMLPTDILNFNEEGYTYSETDSTETEWVFLRSEQK